MPAETRGYLPQFVALTYTMNYLNEHDIVADSLDYPISFDTITIKQYLNLEVFTKELNVAMEDFVELNPSFLKNYFPGHRPVLIRIPSDKMVYYAQNEAHILDLAGKRDIAVKEIPVLVKSYSQKASKTTTTRKTTTKIIYTVRSGDVLGRIADKHNVTLTQIKNWNGIKGTTIRPGQKLIIHKSGTSSSSSARTNAATSSPSKIPSYYYVKPGDTLWTISKKYDGLTVEKIKKLNNLKDGNIKTGQKLKLI
jgi:membrane-bound lytic murein transglycosylase D